MRQGNFLLILLTFSLLGAPINAQTLISLANTIGGIPKSVLTFWTLEREPGFRPMFFRENIPVHANEGPIYTSRCRPGDSGELVGYGCADVCRMVAHWESQGRPSGYIIPDPINQFLGHPAHRDELTLYDGYKVPLYFTSESSRAECMKKLETQQLIVAYGGWCASGVESPDVHFASPIRGAYHVESNVGPTGQEILVLYISNITQIKNPPSARNSEYAARYLLGILAGLNEDSELDVRGRHVPPYATETLSWRTPKRGVDYPISPPTND